MSGGNYMTYAKALKITNELRAKAFWERLDKEDRSLYRKTMKWIEKYSPEMYREELLDESDCCCSRNLV